MFAKFLEYSKRIRQPIIAVAGDMMIDEYYDISAERLSPEFPIPIYVSKDLKPTSALPGGAGNVVRQLHALGADANISCFLNDYAARVLEEHGLGTYSVDKVEFKIPIKRRLYYDNFPLCRWDIEQPNYGFEGNLDDYRRWANETLADFEANDHRDQCHAIILSDYNKGFFSERIDIERWIDFHWTDTWRDGDKPLVVVDPKKGPASKWKGCDVFKPNRKEAKELSGFNDIEDQLKKLQEETEAQIVIITCEGDGVSCLNRNEIFHYKPPTKTVANSVIGAGDCFVSVLTLGLVYKMECYDAVEAAFLAGTKYVKNKRNQPITLEDLID